MTTKLEQAARQALEALEQNTYYNFDDDIKALREALAEPDMNLSCKSVQARLATSWGYVKAEQAEQEPVARGQNFGERFARAVIAADRELNKCQH